MGGWGMRRLDRDVVTGVESASGSVPHVTGDALPTWVPSNAKAHTALSRGFSYPEQTVTPYYPVQRVMESALG